MYYISIDMTLSYCVCVSRLSIYEKLKQDKFACGGGVRGKFIQLKLDVGSRSFFVSTYSMFENFRCVGP